MPYAKSGFVQYSVCQSLKIAVDHMPICLFRGLVLKLELPPHAAEMKVGKYDDHFPDDTFVPLAVETYGCLDSAFQGFLGACARRAAELRAGGLGSVPMASRLISYYRSRVSISLQRSQARAIHHRAARAVQSSTGARPLSPSGWFCSIGKFVH
jgi:hypothetical protein